MGVIKKLAGQTLIYGLGTIAPRLLNYLLLTPFYTEIFQKSEYGIVTELYAYVALMLVLLTYGMETTFFRFIEKEPQKNHVFSTISLSLLITSGFFVFLIFSFTDPIASFIKYEHNPEYIQILSIILALDAFIAIPFARLRFENKAVRFSSLKIINILINIALNLTFFVWMPRLYASDSASFLLNFYNPEIGVGYAFIANLVATVITSLLLLPEILKIRFQFDWSMYKSMLRYAWPLVILGIAGMINEVSDKFIFKFLMKVPEGIEDGNEYLMSLVGVYGANTKLAVLMMLFIQMFKFAAEPFFFSQAKEKNSKATYAEVMKYFVVFGLFIFLSVMLYLDVVKFFINQRYHEGLFVVPIILLGNLFLGIFYNLSVWYKLNDLTRYGAVIAVVGSVITLIINIIFVPIYSYSAAAWAHFFSYFVMMLLSYWWGRKYFPVNYPLKSIGAYFALALLLFFIHQLLPNELEVWMKYTIRSLLLATFVLVVFKVEKKNLRFI